MTKTIFLINLLICATVKNGSSKIRKGYVTLQKYIPCKEPAAAWPMHITLKKFNRTTTAFDMNLTLTDNFDDSLSIELDIRRWSDGGWKYNFIKFEKDKACSTFMMLFKSIARSLLDGAGIPKKCPVAKNTYAVKNAVLSLLESPLLAYTGRFWVIFLLKDPTGDVKYCTESILQVDEIIYKR